MLSAEAVLFGPTLVLVAISASITDYKYRKIHNSLIIRALLASLVLNVVYFLNSDVVISTYLYFLAVSAAASLILWLIKFWKPGDVKFYFVLSSFLHPKFSSDFLMPFLVFAILSIIWIAVDVIKTKEVEFKFKFEPSTLLAVGLFPILASIGISFIVGILLLFLIGKKIKKMTNIIFLMAIASFLINPSGALQILCFVLLFSVINSFKFKGNLASGPLLSASFIYCLVFAQL
ncbi:MAG: hypothetical protein GOU99_01790 [Candidatus Altiarchaeota archaeon]|nr:hypothetical protein [Candidatus Altiarchaeota archaeon]